MTVTAYDARNQPESRTVGEGTAEASSESFAYDTAGRLVTRTDARSHDWTREYDGYGRLAASVDPLGNRAEQLYDDGGQVKEFRFLGSGGGLLAKGEASYDLLGRPVEQTRHLWSSDPASASAVTGQPESVTRTEVVAGGGAVSTPTTLFVVRLTVRQVWRYSSVNRVASVSTVDCRRRSPKHPRKRPERGANSPEPPRTGGCSSHAKQQEA